MAADPTTTTAVATAAASTTPATLKSAADKQQQQSDSRKQQGSSHTITALCQPVKTLHTLLGIPEHMELSQIELIYRAEGNANLVLALPQFKKVLRLPKMFPNVKQQQQQPQHEREKEQEQQRSTSGTFLNQSARAGDLTMEDFVAYIEVIRRILGNEFIFEADLVQIPKKADRDWINKHIKAARPAHRRDKEFCGQFGLVLPDATQLPAAIDILHGNSQQATATSAAATTKYELQPRERTGVGAGAGAIGDTYAVEIKPKQGWLLPTDVNDLFDTIKPTTATATTATTAAMPATTEATATTATKTTTSATLVPAQALAKMAKTNTRCRYCSMQYLKLQQHKISRLSSYCPIELFSGTPARMIAALHALFECPQNNLRVFRNGVLIYGDHAESMSWQQLKDTVFQSDKLQLIKHLLVACLLRDYGSAAAEVAAAEAGAAAVVKAAAGQPHSRVTPAAAEPVTETEAPATRATRAPRTQAQVSEAEMLRLPENCVLQKILHLQLLAKRNLRHMFQAGYASYETKSYAALNALLSKRHEVFFESLQHVQEYLLGATALDCSIMLTFREMCSEASLPPHPQLPQLVQMPAHKKCYWTKVTILDLDPKPDSHFCKYVKQTKQSNACQQLS